MHTRALAALALVSALLLPAPLLAQEPEPEAFTPLFNGQNLDGWDTKTGVDKKRVATGGGVLRLRGDSGWLLASDTYYDFVLQFDARSEPGSVGGVLLRMFPTDDRSKAGYEFQLADGQGRAGRLRRRLFKNTFDAVESDLTVPISREWQSFRIECRRDVLTASIDGQPVKNVRGLVQNAGRVGFYVERGAIEFRGVEVQRDADPEASAVAGVVTAKEEGVSLPAVRHEVRPTYTSSALSATAQGEVWLQCVVLADGMVGDVAVLRPLRPDLDANAIAAAKRWRFKPGTRNGEPVAVLVTISMSFILRSY